MGGDEDMIEKTLLESGSEGKQKKDFLTEDRLQEERGEIYRLSVLLARPFMTPFEYLSHENFPAGTIIRVPLGRSEVWGCVWDGYRHKLPANLRQEERQKQLAQKKLKFILYKLEGDASLPETLRNFIDWVAAYTLAPSGMVLAMALRAVVKSSFKKQRGLVKITPLPASLKMTESRKNLLSCASETTPKSAAELAEESGVTLGVVRGLLKQGALEEKEITPLLWENGRSDYQHPSLSEAQKEAALLLCDAVKKEEFKVFLLEGVTGSGKTEVYFEALETCLHLGKQILILLPEIALTAQWRSRFKARFGVLPAIWHSDLSQKERRETWQGIFEGRIPVLVGARSALFLPFQNLGLVIVDEEHETSFKQGEGVHYHGRDMAVLRARLSQSPVILASATPSLETLINVRQGRYQHIQLRQRYGKAELPTIEILNMRENPPQQNEFLSPILKEAMTANIEKGEQTLLFLNRRGYAPLTLCRHCGYRFQCPNCSAWLVMHRGKNLFACHHCEHTEPFQKTCPECGEEESFMAIGPGVERLAEEVHKNFPDARYLVMTTDTMSDKAQMEKAVEDISQGKIDILIGTQMVAKGWHFPYLTLVGVVDADLGLGGGDLRAGEKTMQLLHQVAGRAGREERKGHVILQSYVAEHPVMQALQSQNIDAFLTQEALMREPGFWPPYGRLAALIISGPEEESLNNFVREMTISAPWSEGVTILGPTPAPLAFLRGRYRRRFLVKGRKNIALQPLIRKWISAHRPKEGIQIQIDIDPISFM